MVPVDDLPPATAINSIRPQGSKLLVSGTSHDNGKITRVTVNGTQAEILRSSAGVVDWQMIIGLPADQTVTAHAARCCRERRAHPAADQVGS
jgi:hypothetical protein